MIGEWWRFIQPYKSRISRFLWGRYNRVRYRNATLKCIIWPPALDIADKVIADIATNYRVSSKRDFEVSHARVREFIQQLYALDRASPGKIAPKISRLLTPPHKFCTFEVTLKKPDITPHSDNNSWRRSKLINQIKGRVRKKFCNQIHDYVYDVIIHSVEFPEQNKHIERLIEKYRDIDRKEKS